MFTKEKCPRPGLRGLILKYYSQSFAISLDSRLLQCFFLEFPILSSRKSLTLHRSQWTILTLHLLIIWALTQVSVPSDTLSGSLWVAVVKIVLFRGLFHINVARKVTTVHLMQWEQLSFRYFWVPFFLACLWGTSLSLELLWRSLSSLEYISKPYSS